MARAKRPMTTADHIALGKQLAEIELLLLKARDKVQESYNANEQPFRASDAAYRAIVKLRAHMYVSVVTEYMIANQRPNHPALQAYYPMEIEES